MITLVHRVYLLYFPERKKIFVNELGSLERKVFQHTIVNKNQFFLKIGQHNFWGFLKICSPYLGSLKKFGQHIWGSEKMA